MKVVWSPVAADEFDTAIGYLAEGCYASRVMAATELAPLDELFEQAKRLPPEARRELRDRLNQSLEEEGVTRDSPPKGPYASLLRAAGTARSLSPDVARNKKKYLAEAYTPKRVGR